MAFEGPVPLTGWVRERRTTGVFVVCHPVEARSGMGLGWRVVHVGALDAIADATPLTLHPLFPHWAEESGGPGQLHLAFHNMPSQDSRHRDAIVRSLVAEYRPPGNA